MSLPLPTLRRYLRQHVVTVFSVSYCPYCDAIKALIGGARTTHVMPDLDTSATVTLPSTRSTKAKTLTCTGDTIRTALKRLLPHHQTVPCVFVRDTFVGGYDDVKALVDNGTWAAKVAAAVPLAAFVTVSRSVWMALVCATTKLTSCSLPAHIRFSRGS